MIISRTPLRISLFGGGTDVPEFYKRHPGAVLSFSIDKYIYVSVNPKFDGRTRVSYSITENVDEVGEIQHDLVRETLKFLGVRRVEITSVSDIPGEGSGLGSSSAFLVGLLRALRGWKVPPNELADQAYHIERERCGHPVGRQDHLAAAFGGLCYHSFFDHERVMSTQLFYRFNDSVRELERNLMLFYLGTTRKADTVLHEQNANLEYGKSAFDAGIRLYGLASDMTTMLADGNYGQLGYALHENWVLKKKLAEGVSNPSIDGIYGRALQAGAEGGKVCGAGGGGFLLLYVKPQHRVAVRTAVNLREVPFRIEPHGSQVIYG